MKKSLIIIFNLILFFSLVTLSHAVEEYEFLRKWITQLDGYNIHPSCITTDNKGFVYVAGNQKIAKYTSDGTFVLKIENIKNSDDYYFSSWQMYVAVDNSGNIYVSSTDDNIIVKFDSQGNYSGTKWDSWNDGADQRFNYPLGIAVDDSENVYVCDNSNHRIVKFNSAGVYQATFGKSGGGNGSGNGEFQHPEDVALDDSGNIYVADSGNSRYQVLDSSGTYVTEKGDWGTGDGQFKNLNGIAVDLKTTSM